MSVIKQESKPRRVIESYDSIGPSLPSYILFIGQQRFQNCKNRILQTSRKFLTPFPSVPRRSKKPASQPASPD